MKQIALHFLNTLSSGIPDLQGMYSTVVTSVAASTRAELRGKQAEKKGFGDVYLCLYHLK